MKSFYFILSVLFISTMFLVQSAKSQVTVSGCTGAGNGSYATLSAAASAIVATQPSANIVITITNNTTEPVAGATLAAGTWTSLTIKPSGGSWTISGVINAGAPLLNLNGSDNVTINGLNTEGNALTFSNTTASATSGTSTIQFKNDATNNTITNCTILGSYSGSVGLNGGNISFSTGTLTGNDNNTISYCNLGPAGTNIPTKLVNGIGSTTSSAIANSTILIDHCIMHDFFLTGGCAAVYAITGNSDWSISNNIIYQTDTRTFTAAGTMYGIYFSNATYGNNIQITGNTIGYSSGTGTGTLILDGSDNAGQFQGIYLNAMPTAATTCNVNNNIISDISLTSSTGSFYGIYNSSTATSNTINIDSNTIRNISANNTTGTIYAIYTGSAITLSASNNTINKISRTGNGQMMGFYLATVTNCTVSNNTISNFELNNSTSASLLYGIYNGGAVNVTANANTIFNLTSTSTASVNIFAIRELSGGTGNKEYRNNIINNLSAGGGAMIGGIQTGIASSPNPLYISGNVISTINGALYIYGIEQSSASITADIYDNKIFDLSSATSSPSVYGIYLLGGTTNNVYNNVIGDLRTPAANSSIPMAGIYVISSSTSINIYYNTIYLNATSSGALFGSAALYVSSATPTVDLRNNILVNTSTHKGTGYTTTYRRSSTVLTNYASTSNNNLFYAGTPGTNNLIMYNGNSYSTLASYKTFVGPTRDNASVTELPPFVNILTTPYDLHIKGYIPTQCQNGGIRIISPFAVTTDYDGNIRWGEQGYTGSGTAPDIGADEFDSSSITGIIIISKDIPRSFKLYENYPNPFNPTTTINYDVPKNIFVKLVVYDISGKKVETLVNKNLQAGEHKAVWNGSNYTSGVYFARIEAGSYTHTIKMLMVK